MAGLPGRILTYTPTSETLHDQEKKKERGDTGNSESKTSLGTTRSISHPSPFYPGWCESSLAWTLFCQNSRSTGPLPSMSSETQDQAVVEGEEAPLNRGEGV